MALAFAVETLTQLRITGEMFGQDFDGDGAFEPRVARAIDLAHSSGAESRQNLLQNLLRNLSPCFGSLH